MQNQSDKNTLLFTKFSLEPGDEWAHIVNFLNFFTKDQEREYRKYEEGFLSNFRNKKNEYGENSKELIEMDTVFVQPFHDFFQKYFIWEAGEYRMTVNVSTDRENVNITKQYRFTIFESDEERLKVITDQFKFGGGILVDPPNIQTNVILELKEI